MGKAPCSDKTGLKKGPWTADEDLKLTDYIQKHGIGNWRYLPKNAGLKRCGKSCRLRWTNYLRPDIKRGRLSFEEEETIIQLHSILGNKWSAIAARLPGRTDNEIKNYWNTSIRKKLLKMGIDPITHAPCFNFQELPSILTSSSQLSIPHNLLGLAPTVNPDLLINLVASLLSSQSTNTSTDITSQNQQNQLANSLPQDETFQPFMIESNTILPPNSNQPIVYGALPINSTTTSSKTQPIQANMELFSQDIGQFGCPNSAPASCCLWQTSYSNIVDDEPSFVPTLDSGYDHHDHNSDQYITNFLSKYQEYDNNYIPNLSFRSVLSTPSSSMMHLNVNGNAEEERDSYCSNTYYV